MLVTDDKIVFWRRNSTMALKEVPFVEDLLIYQRGLLSFGTQRLRSCLICLLVRLLPGVYGFGGGCRCPTALRHHICCSRWQVHLTHRISRICICVRLVLLLLWHAALWHGQILPGAEGAVVWGQRLSVVRGGLLVGSLQRGCTLSLEQGCDFLHCGFYLCFDVACEFICLFCSLLKFYQVSIIWPTFWTKKNATLYYNKISQLPRQK